VVGERGRGGEGMGKVEVMGREGEGERGVSVLGNGLLGGEAETGRYGEDCRVSSMSGFFLRGFLYANLFLFHSFICLGLFLLLSFSLGRELMLWLKAQSIWLFPLLFSPFSPGKSREKKYDRVRIIMDL